MIEEKKKKLHIHIQSIYRYLSIKNILTHLSRHMDSFLSYRNVLHNNEIIRSLNLQYKYSVGWKDRTATTHII